MKNSLKCIVVFFVIIFCLCTEKERAFSWGGSSSLTIPEDCQFLNITWKDSNVWMLVDCGNEYRFLEHSSWGVMNGKIIIKKNKNNK